MMKVLHGLAGEHAFTVFGARMDESLRRKVDFHQVFHVNRKLRIVGSFAQYLCYGALFRRQRLGKRFDLVHGLESASPYAHIVSLHYCAPYVCDLMKQGVIASQGIYGAYRRLHNTFGGMMDGVAVRNPYIRAVTCVSEGLRRQILRYYHPSVDAVVIPNSVNVAYFADAGFARRRQREQLGFRDDDIIGIICAWGDWERKGLKLLIDAVSKEKDKPIKILVVGGGRLSPYQERCADYGIADKFKFVGKTTCVKDFYGAADFFILPSAFEGWPLVALEAAAAGLPIVATRVNGLEDFIDDGVNGFFIERSVESVMNAFARVIRTSDHLARMGNAAREKAREFSETNMIAAYRSLYARCANQGARILLP